MSRETLGFVELEWTCPKCDSRNPGPQKTCVNCGAPQPEDVQFEQVQGKELVKDEELQKQVEAGADIHCAFCGARNPASANICSQCGADLREGKRREKGRVVGAYKKEPVRQVACPNCGTENPQTALKCSACGASLPRKGTPTQGGKGVVPLPAESTPISSKSSRWFIGLGIVLVFLCVCGVAAFLLLSSPRESQEGVVQEVNWKTSIEIEALQPVDHQTWRDEIPIDAQVGRCEDKVHHVQDNEPVGDKYNKICGTPYTLDTGTGQGEVVQDCKFEVMMSYCDYSVDEWQVIDEVSQSGAGFAPTWSEPTLGRDQRLGDRDETYMVIFESPEDQYTYSVSSFDDFQQFQIGSEWLLNINAFDQVVSVEPIR